ncbi:MAG: rod shape-determining protein MreD [Acidobacteriaceae bacterium]
MLERSYTSREELDQYGFHPGVTVLAPLICILLQAMLPKTVPWLVHIDLPLIATIFFAVSRRSPIAGTVTGTLIGLFQDGLTNHPFGVDGIAKGVIGYVAASLGFAVDIDNVVNRVALVFTLSLAQSGLLFLIAHWLLGETSYQFLPVMELIGAAANCVVAVPMFYVLDRFRIRD